jgi:hypothetical protein
MYYNIVMKNKNKIAKKSALNNDVQGQVTRIIQMQQYMDENGMGRRYSIISLPPKGGVGKGDAAM